MDGLTGDVSPHVRHLEERHHVFSVDVDSLLLVAAGVDEHFQIPGAAAEPCTCTHTHKG